METSSDVIESPFSSRISKLQITNPKQKNLFNEKLSTERAFKVEHKIQKKKTIVTFKKQPIDKSSWTNNEILLSPIEYPSEIHPFFDIMADKVDIVNQSVKDGWKKIVSTSDLKCYKKLLGNDEDETVRIHALFDDVQVEAFPLFFFHAETRLRWDKETKEVEEIEVNLKEGYKVFRVEFKPPIPMINRRENLIKFALSDELREKNAIFINSDTTSHEKVPERKNVTRSDMKSFFYMERISEKRTKLVMLIRMNLRGNIPDFIQKIIPDKIGTVFTKRIKDNIGQVKDVEKLWSNFGI